jgi:hypothetical protein
MQVSRIKVFVQNVPLQLHAVFLCNSMQVSRIKVFVPYVPLQLHAGEQN